MTVAETLRKALDILWDGRENQQRDEWEYICHAIESFGDRPAENAAKKFLRTYGISMRGSGFYRPSDDSLSSTYWEQTALRQARRMAFLRVAIRHATRLGI